ncbi:leucine-rich repeat extensin-like protein 1 [Gossypium australe]|uniref:Leucine-rich repeat extensin-like protein 1 n=1 Tax=Gossypium australe TaxID=47621 RepID=A0A5B6XCK5_9ROSI|nr:leucine-rich repeat extensin-like protein 1 [Gossypium australe]
MGRVFQGSKWLKIGIMGMIMLARVTSEHEMGTPPDGSLCISECTTCPVICSPPPPSQLKSFSPPSPSVHNSPPEPDYIPPQLPDSQCSPPPLESASPPPPRFEYFYNAPNGQGPPAIVGPIQYPYPYYYVSKASPLSFQASLSLVMLFCFTVVLLRC